jgi:DNA-binding CsgD family transcriptional regulator
LSTDRLQIRHVRAVDRIVHECLDLWSDAEAWQTHLLREGAALVGLRVGLFADLKYFGPDEETQIVSAIEHGWESERQRLRFFASASPDGPKPFAVSPVDLQFRQVLASRNATTRVRSDLMENDRWFNHWVYHDVHRPADMHEVAYSAIRGEDRDRVTVLAFGGSDAVPGGRQRRMLALLHHQIARHARRRLATFSDPGPHHLTPRQREVYDLLLTGASERAIALRLKRSRSTITEHIAAIYALFGVTSRIELMARLLRPPG